MDVNWHEARLFPIVGVHPDLLNIDPTVVGQPRVQQDLQQILLDHLHTLLQLTILELRN
jgi:hypothetical protein